MNENVEKWLVVIAVVVSTIALIVSICVNAVVEARLACL